MMSFDVKQPLAARGLFFEGALSESDKGSARANPL